MKQKHKWESLGFFTFACSVCDEFDSVSKKIGTGEYTGIENECNRIQNRTDCFELFMKHKVVPRLLGKT